MENNPIEGNVEEEVVRTKPPVFLIVLAVLSILYVSSNLFNSVAALVSGPKSSAEIAVAEEAITKSVAQMQNMGQEGFANMFQTIIERIHYMNDVVFYKQNILNFIVALVGLVAVVLMLKLKKIGFHLYIIYSLLFVGIVYLVFPMKMILNIEIIFSLFVSALFCLLYGLNLKAMR